MRFEEALTSMRKAITEIQHEMLEGAHELAVMYQDGEANRLDVELAYEEANELRNAFEDFACVASAYDIPDL